MNREQAKAYKAMVQLISFRDSKQIAFQLLNQAVGHNGIEEHWPIFCHFANGGEVEVKYRGYRGWGNSEKDNCKFCPENDYRKVEKPFILGGIELPERPQTEPLNKGDIYYLPGLSAEFLFIDLTWYDDIADMAALENNQVYLTEKGAVAAAKAMLAMVEQALKGEN